MAKLDTEISNVLLSSSSSTMKIYLASYYHYNWGVTPRHKFCSGKTTQRTLGLVFHNGRQQYSNNKASHFREGLFVSIIFLIFLTSLLLVATVSPFLVPKTSHIVGHYNQLWGLMFTADTMAMAAWCSFSLTNFIMVYDEQNCQSFEELTYRRQVMALD